MQYIITFLEGFISFISPCMLPMLPVYISYFAGGKDEKHKTIFKALAFVLGFTVVFTSMGLFAGSLGAFLRQYQTAVNIISGLTVIVFGLSYLEIIKLPFFRGVNKTQRISGVFSAFMFGLVYSTSLTPCVGAFLGSALMLASSTGGVIKGTLLLLTYSLGLGIPFVFSATFIYRFKGTFDFIKNHYKEINLISGIFLILIGFLMMSGLLNSLLSLFS